VQTLIKNSQRDSDNWGDYDDEMDENFYDNYGETPKCSMCREEFPDTFVPTVEKYIQGEIKKNHAEKFSEQMVTV